MIYYKVKPEFDQRPMIIKTHLGPVQTIYIENELFTPKEVEKLKLNKTYLTKVEVPRNRVYSFFGARFDDMDRWYK